jgi:hypothetical protein
MSTSTGTITFYDRALLAMFAGLNWTSTSTTFCIGLLIDSYTPNVVSHTVYANVSASQHATANGYTQPGLTISGSSYTTTGSSTTLLGTWDFTDPVWTASGGSIAAKYYFIYTPTSVLSTTNSLIAYGLLDNGGATVTTTDTNTLTINVDSSGFFTTSIA